MELSRVIFGDENEQIWSVWTCGFELFVRNTLGDLSYLGI